MIQADIKRVFKMSVDCHYCELTISKQTSFKLIRLPKHLASKVAKLIILYIINEKYIYCILFTSQEIYLFLSGI